MSTDLGEPEHRDGGPIFWLATAVGWCIILGAVVGAFADRRDAHPWDLLRWVLAGALVHDLLWLPIVAVVGLALSRATRGRLPRVIRWALVTSAVLAAVAWPFVRGYGRRPGNPSLLPRNYAAGLAVYLAAIWLVALAVVAAGTARRVVRRSRSDAEASSEGFNG
jgi:hypothetical protein